MRTARGEAEAALEGLSELASRNPDHPETLFALSRAHAAAGRPERAAETLAGAIDSVPDRHPWLGPFRESWERLLSEERERP